MSQVASFVLENQSGSEFRSKLNDIIQALVSVHKGASAPASPVAGMAWIDDSATPFIVKRRTASAWVVEGYLNASTGVYTPYLPDGCVSGDIIPDEGIDGGHIAEEAVTAYHIADGAVGTDELAAGAVTPDKLETDAVTPDKIATGRVNLGSISGTVNINLNSGRAFEGLLAGDVTFTISNPKAAGNEDSFTVYLTADAGPSSITLPESVLIDLDDLTAGAVHVFTFFTIDGGVSWFGFLAGVFE